MNESERDIKHNRIDGIIENGIYRHYKGNRYEVIGIARHSETLEYMVVYRAVSDRRQLWVRPAGMWSEFVDTANGKVRRFTRIDPADENRPDDQQIR